MSDNDNPAFVVAIPRTGYMVLHTVARDGKEPYDSIYIPDPTAVTNDITALEHFRATMRNLLDAPSNVIHTMRLIHRTPAGDRDLSGPHSVRGRGVPLP